MHVSYIHTPQQKLYTLVYLAALNTWAELNRFVVEMLLQSTIQHQQTTTTTKKRHIITRCCLWKVHTLFSRYQLNPGEQQGCAFVKKTQWGDVFGKTLINILQDRRRCKKSCFEKTQRVLVAETSGQTAPSLLMGSPYWTTQDTYRLYHRSAASLLVHFTLPTLS